MYMGAMRTKGQSAANRDINRYTNHSSAPTSGYTTSHAPLSSASGSRSEYPPSPEQNDFNVEPQVRPLPNVPRTVSYNGSEKSGDPEQQGPPPAPASSGSDVRLPISPERQQELAASRMRLPDRPQDWGPIREEDLLNLELPPNYQQAIEPLPAPISSSSGGSGERGARHPSASPES